MLTWAERLTLWNQYEILKLLDPENTKEYKTSQEIVSNGYEQFYSEINQSIYQETVSTTVSEEVIKILNMFRAIKFSCDRLSYVPKNHVANFKGFDANDSGGHFGFACFLRRTLGRWDELEDCPDNSHSSGSLSSYRLMCKTWRQFDESPELTAEQIEKIATL